MHKKVTIHDNLEQEIDELITEAVHRKTKRPIKNIHDYLRCVGQNEIMEDMDVTVKKWLKRDGSMEIDLLRQKDFGGGGLPGEDGADSEDSDSDSDDDDDDDDDAEDDDDDDEDDEDGAEDRQEDKEQEKGGNEGGQGGAGKEEKKKEIKDGKEEKEVESYTRTGEPIHPMLTMNPPRRSRKGTTLGAMMKTEEPSRGANGGNRARSKNTDGNTAKVGADDDAGKRLKLQERGSGKASHSFLSIEEWARAGYPERKRKEPPRRSDRLAKQTKKD